MADILIKNMEMPKNCLSCPSKEHCLAFGKLHFNERLKMLDECRRADNCPIIGEIPDSHGRLIDADTLLPKSGYDPMMFKHKYDGDHRTQYDTLMGYEILGIVEDALTIVEATE